MKRPLKSGDICYVRVRVIQKMDEKGFGEWCVEPITRSFSQTRRGMYLYVNREEMITKEEAREVVK